MERHWKIWNDIDLRRAYDSLMFFRDLKRLPEYKEYEGKEVIDRTIVNLKKGIREYLGMAASLNKERRVIKDECTGGFIELIELGEWFEDQADAEEYFEENYYRRCMPSIYDCTGQIFTAWYKVFRRHGQWMAYHCMAMDV